MNESQSDILLNSIVTTRNQLDSFLKSLAKTAKPQKYTKTQGILLERIYLNLVGLEALQTKILTIGQMKSSLFLVLRAIISDMLSCLFYDLHKDNEKLITKINDLHSRDYFNSIDFIIENELDFTPLKENEKSKIIKESKEKLRKRNIHLYKGSSFDSKLKSYKEILKDTKWPYKDSTISDKFKFEVIKNISEEHPIGNLKSHYIYLAYKVFSQHQHFSINSENQLLPISKPELILYKRTLIFLMMTIEQTSSNLKEANDEEIELLRKIIQKNARILIQDFK